MAINPARAARTLPEGTVTFLFTDIQGSTTMVQALGIERWQEILGVHHALLRDVFARNQGSEVKTEGDAFFVAFASAADAVAACADGQRALAGYNWPHDAVVRVRMGVHTGEARVIDDDYIGLDIHRAARVAATGHGGQVVLSDSTRVLVEHTLPPGVSLLDLGEHRLKDLARAEHLWQLELDGLQEVFPALKSLDSTPNNLPTQVTSFIGREHDLEEAARLLEANRVLTLTGPGGTGKTRLSLQLAAEVINRFADGVMWVGLAPIDDPDLVLPAIAQVLGLKDSSGDTRMDTLRQHLGSRSLLLVLDNFEQVLGAASDLAELVKAAPGLKVVVTSRAPLRIYGEQEFPVPPLSLPDTGRLPTAESLGQFAAVQLFIARALAVKPDFRVTNENAPAVAALCALVDGLPLAIELAAARVRLLNPEAILKHLESRLGDLGGGARDLPARQQTLRGAIGWSYDILEPEVRRLMDRFSVFARGGALEQVEAVCGPGLGVDVLSGLEVLVEQSLVRPVDEAPETRFMMLHVIREFAMERLAASDDSSEVHGRHAGAFLELAEVSAPHLTGGDQKAWLDRLELEHDNIRAALVWFVSRDLGDEASRLVAATWRFWHIRGHLAEGLARAQQVLAMPVLKDLPRARLRTLECAGGIAWWQGEDMPLCLRYYEEALAIAREVGSTAEIANAVYNTSFPFSILDVGQSRDRIGEAEALFEAAGDRPGAARAMWSSSSTALVEGDWALAMAKSEAAAAIFREIDSTFDLAWAFETMGVAAIRLGDKVRAREALDKSLRLLVDSGDISGIPLLIVAYADLAASIGDDERAIRLRGAAAGLQLSSGARLAEASHDAYGGGIETGIGLDPERLRQWTDEGQRMSVDEAVAYALEGDERTA